jgi:hypothetical protein
MSFDLDRRPPLTVGTRVLVGVAAAAAVLGGVMLVLTLVGMGQFDVRGLPLRGSLLATLLGGLALAVVGAAVAAAGLCRRARWAVALLAAVWPGFALLCLTIDRMSPAPGPGRSLAFYLVGIGLLPAAATLLLGRGARGRSGDMSVTRPEAARRRQDERP